MHVLLLWIVYVTAVVYCSQISVAQLDGNGKIVPSTEIVDYQEILCMYSQMNLIVYEVTNVSNKKYCQLMKQGCDTVGAVRLVGSASELEGRVEMCTQDMTWTAVCGEVLSQNEARVICRMLGYSQMSRLIHAITC